MKSILFCLFIFASLHAISQSSLLFDEFGKVDKAELEMTDCSFDKGAPGVILLNISHTKFASNEGWWQCANHRLVRFKVLKESAEKYANVKLRFYSKDSRQKIIDLSAYSYNIDQHGTIIKTKLESNAVYTKPIDEKFSEVSFAMPNVKVGTVFEYTYSLMEDFFSDMPDWYFQDELPVARSEFVLNLESTISFNYVIYKSNAYNVNVFTDKRKENMYFTMDNIPGLDDEPYMTAEKDYLQHVDIQMTEYYNNYGVKTSRLTSWEKITDELLSDNYFGGELRRNLTIPDGVKTVIKSTNLSQKDKMIQLYQFVSKRMQWNGQRGFYVLGNLKKNWEQNTGHSGEINFILINLLKEAGIKAMPVLVSTRGHGKVYTEYPFLFQFNTVMTYVAMEDGNYVLDASLKNQPIDFIPKSIMNTNGLVVDRKDGGIIELKVVGKEHANIISINAAIDAAGMIKGQAIINSKAYARVERESLFRQSPSRYREAFFSKNNTNLTIDSIKVDNLDSSYKLPIVQSVNFTGNATSNGQYLYFSPNIFTGLEKNEFTSEKRFSDIDFGMPQKKILVASFELPNNYSIESIPANIRLTMPDSSIVFSRLAQMDGNELGIRIVLEFKQASYDRNNYYIFKDFYKKMFGYLNEQVVLVKKK